MPSILGTVETVLNVEREIVEIVAVQSTVRGSCHGCEMEAANISCSKPSSCHNVVWAVRRDPVVNRGPYHEAYRLLQVRRKQEEVDERRASEIRKSFRWDGAYWQVLGLQSYLARTRDLYQFEMAKPVQKALEKFGLPQDWYKLAMQFPTWYPQERGLIQYFNSEAKLTKYGVTPSDGLRTPTKLGRYIATHWPHIADHEIRNLVALYGPAKIEIVKTVEQMVEAVTRGPRSCMQWELSEEYDGAYDVDGVVYVNHPYEVYQPELGWAMAITKVDGRITGRALVYENGQHKCFVRSYGKDSDGYSSAAEDIDSQLKEMGYKYLNKWPEGVKLAYIPADNKVGFLSPYLDPGPQRADSEARRCDVATIDGTKYLVRADAGDYILDDTEGVASHQPIRPQICQACGVSHHSDESVVVGLGPIYTRVCSSCIDHYIRARNGQSEYIWAPVEDVGYVPSLGRHYLLAFLSDGDSGFVQVESTGRQELWEYSSRVIKYEGKAYSRESVANSDVASSSKPYVRTYTNSILRRGDAIWSHYNYAWLDPKETGYFGKHGPVALTDYKSMVRSCRSAQQVKDSVAEQDLLEAMAMWTEKQALAGVECPVKEEKPKRIFDVFNAAIPDLMRAAVTLRDSVKLPPGAVVSRPFSGSDSGLIDFSDLENAAISAMMLDAGSAHVDIETYAASGPYTAASGEQIQGEPERPLARFSMSRTRTGRISSSTPNLQELPLIHRAVSQNETSRRLTIEDFMRNDFSVDAAVRRNPDD